MPTPRPSRLAAVLAGASILASCHAHGGQGVTIADHGVTITFNRHMTQPSIVLLDIKNGSATPICLDPASFQAASFSVKMDSGMVQNITPATPSAAACDVLAAGADKSQSVDAGQGFSRANEQVGRFCYHYDFGPYPVAGAAWRTSGLICE